MNEKINEWMDEWASYPSLSFCLLFVSLVYVLCLFVTCLRLSSLSISLHLPVSHSLEKHLPEAPVLLIVKVKHS